MKPEPATPRAVREWRRMQELELKQAGCQQGAIGAVLGVTEGAVSQWLRAARQAGAAALVARPVPGAPARLPVAQRQQLSEFLCHGAETYGFCREFGVIYSKSQVSRLLHALD